MTKVFPEKEEKIVQIKIRNKMAASKSGRALNLLMSVMRAAEVLPDHVSGSCRSCSAEQVVHEPGAAAAGRESGQNEDDQ